MKKNAKNIIIPLLGMFICIMTVLISKWMKGLDGDNAPQTYAAYVQIANSIFSGEMPFWNPYIWGGIPQMGSPISEGFYPINWLLCMLCYNKSTHIVSYAIIPLNLVIHIAVYYIGIFLILKKIIRINNNYAALFATLAVLSPSFAKFYTWIVYFDGIAWFPILIYLTYMTLKQEGKKYGISLGIVFGLEALLSVSVALVISIFFLLLMCICFFQKNKSYIKAACKVIKSGILGIVIGFPSILSTFIYVCNSTRFVPEIGYLESIKKIPIEYFNTNTCSISDVIGLFNIKPIDSFISINIFIFIFSIYGMFKRKKTRFEIFVVIGVGFSFLYSIGVIIPDLAYYIPLLSNMREPFMYGCFFNCFLVILAGMGFKTWMNKQRNNSLERVAPSIITVLIALYNILPHVNGGILSLLGFLGIFLVGIASLIDCLSYVIVERIKISILYSITILGIVIWGQYFNQGVYTEVEAISKISKVVEYNKKVLENNINYDRAEKTITWGTGYTAIGQNQGAIIGMREMIGYYNPLPKNTIEIHNNIDLYKRCQLQGIKYVLVNKECGEEFLSYFDSTYPLLEYVKEIELYSSFSSDKLSKIALYEYKDAKTCWGVDKIKYWTDKQECYNWINNDNTNIYEKAIIKDNQSRFGILKENNSINLDESITNNTITIKAKSDEDFLLCTSQIYYPGWIVKVNGKKADMTIVDAVNCGTYVEKGDTVITFSYKPWYIIYPIYVQLMICGIVFIWIILKKRNESIEDSNCC